MVLSSPTLALPSSEAPVLFQVVTSDGYANFSDMQLDVLPYLYMSGIRIIWTRVPPCCEWYHGYKSCKSDCYNPQCHDDASSPWVNPASVQIATVVDYVNFRLDPIANSIANATFDVINEGKVRTADMGGKFLGQGKSEELSLIHNL